MRSPKRTPRNLSGLAILMTALGAAACDNGQPTGPASAGIGQAEAEELAQVINEDADAFIDASTYDDQLGIRVDVPSPRSLGPGQLAGRLPCRPVITPNPPENLDGDRVPDAVLLDYTGVECDVGTLHAAMAGTLGIEDPAIPGFGIRLIFSDLTRTVTRSATGEQLVVSWDGTRQIVGSPSNPGTQLNHTITAFRTDFTFPNGRTAQHVKNWNASFEADVAGSIDYGARLPSGTWSFDGNSTWVRNGTATYAIDLTTTTPLHYNTSCTVAPRFDAGMIVATVTRNGVTATVTIEHPACGQTLVTRTAAS